MAKISVCLITKNEEKMIERALRSVQFADEIVVVDAYSIDRTVEIAYKYNAKVVKNAWQGFAEQRNLGLKHCSHEWVLFVDADEEVSKELADRLVQIAKEPLSVHPNCYAIVREEYFLGQKLNYGPGNPSNQWRFFKRAKVQFQGHVHEYPIFDGPIGLIQERLHHNPDLGIDRFLTKLNSYTTLEALDRFSKGQRTSLLHALGTFFTTFLKNGIRYRGFLNGKVGFVLTTLEAISRVIRHLKLWVFWKVYEGKLRVDLGLTLPKPGSARPPQEDELNKPIFGQENKKI